MRSVTHTWTGDSDIFGNMGDGDGGSDIFGDGHCGREASSAESDLMADSGNDCCTGPEGRDAENLLGHSSPDVLGADGEGSSVAGSDEEQFAGPSRDHALAGVGSRAHLWQMGG